MFDLKRIPPFVPLMALITFVYLTLEVPFSVHLVQVLGNNPTQDEIDHIERCGRVLTGLAVSIWIMGIWIFPVAYKRGQPLLTSAIFAAAIATIVTYSTYRSLDVFAEYIADHSTAEVRHEAFKANLAKGYFAAHGKGDLVPSNENDWNAFISVAAVLSSPGSFVSVAGANVEDKASLEAARFLGTPQHFRARVFEPIFGGVRTAFDSYEEASMARSSRLSGAGQEADRHWNTYRDRLRRQNLAHVTSWSGAGAARVRRQVQASGVPVRDNWHPNDERGFKRAASEELRRQVEERYRNGVNNSAGGYIEPGLRFESFLKHSVIQKRIREDIGLPVSGSPILPEISDGDFVSIVYEPRAASLSKELADAFNSSSGEFSNYGRYEVFGVAAMKATRLPAMAILLSIAGAALHIFKFVSYLSWMYGLSRSLAHKKMLSLRYGSSLALTTCAFGYMFLAGNAITGTSAFAELRARGFYSSVLEGAISIQPKFTFLGNALSFGAWQLMVAHLPASADENSRQNAIDIVGVVSDANYRNLPDTGVPLPTSRPSM
ncbi:hypothetical protein [Aliihoeflea sp. 2WW]|uniref:hypothetical protein n=1 Tax=Aliihoeflea sp. 2WW TaxID=1381123 RepID=UPI000465596B|nr:hypothetical protein [Aliihoeflea sp. 2WW]